MTKDLYIFDVSPFIHAGAINRYAKLEKLVDMGTTWKTMVTPCGGVSLIFNTLYSILGRGDIVFCCDRNPTIKKEMIPGYKGNRDHKRNIEVEKGVAEYILEHCNATVLARAGYEADDIIYSLVRKNHDVYDNIYIYTGDSDLYFLVDDRVTIKPSSSRAKEVTRYNYEQVLSKYNIKYNMMTMTKIICGDTSDCIPGIPKEARNAVATLFYADEMRPYLGDRDFVYNWMKYKFPEYADQVLNVFPLDVDDLPTDFKQIDKESVIDWGSAINNKYFRGMGSKSFPIEEHIEELHKLGMYLEDTN